MAITEKFEISLEPFMTPNFVRMVTRSPAEKSDRIPTLPLLEIDAETLDRLCDQFRTDVFNKAGKSPPDRSSR
jgi:hypothetical protein